MGISASDVISLSQARAAYSELVEEVEAGAEKIIIKSWESYIALIDEASKGLDDVVSGKVKEARSAIQSIKRRRSA